MLLMEYENDYRNNLLDLLAGDVIPDIKSDLMYLSSNVIK